MLTGGPRTADSRQQSLAESIRWSYRLLGDAERTVLQRLAVFRAPFTAEGARALAAGEGVEEHDVLPLLANLVEKSFVVIDERHDASRYRLLETILEYAGSQLAAQPEESQTTRDRHLLYVRRTAERFRSTVQGGVSPQARRRQPGRTRRRSRPQERFVAVDGKARPQYTYARRGHCGLVFSSMPGAHGADCSRGSDRRRHFHCRGSIAPSSPRRRHPKGP